MLEKQQKSGRNSLHASISYRDGEGPELYFWFKDDPFEVGDNRVILTEFDKYWFLKLASGLSETALIVLSELINNPNVSQAAITNDALILNTQEGEGLHTIYSVGDFLDSKHTFVHAVKDRRGKIARTRRLHDRINRVRNVEGVFATIGTPSLIIPRPEAAQLPEVGISPVRDPSESVGSDLSDSTVIKGLIRFMQRVKQLGQFRD